MSYEEQPMGFGVDSPVKKKSKTITELSKEIRYKVIPGISGKALKSEVWYREEIQKARVSKYQRMLSSKHLQSYGKVDMELLIPPIISRRPNYLGEELGGDHIIDGQHKLILYYNGTSLLNEEEKKYGGVRVMVLEHDENSTLQEVELKEAKLFKALNTNHKKLNLVDIYRAEVYENDPTAIHVRSVMENIDVQYDNFGSESPKARIIETFNQFNYTITADYPQNSAALISIKSGYEFWKKIYAKKDTEQKLVNLHGTAFRSICFIDRFITEGLSGKKALKFYEWCVKELLKQFNQKKLVETSGSFDAPRWALYKTILKYNEMMTNEHGGAAACYIIGPETLAAAIKNSGQDSAGEARFMHPDEDTMILMYNLSKEKQEAWRKTVIGLREYFKNQKKKKKS
tara:strand:+ start:1289 stop:2491 length:1203 start_codon:yes stop_codon:yes gene_type:complete